MSRLKHRALDMTVGSPYRLILQFSIPLFFGNLFQQLYNTVDSIVVGNMVGTKALAAVGAGFPYLMIMISLFNGVGMAATILVSQRYGAKDYDGVNLIMNTIYKFAIIAVIPMTIAAIVGLEPILRLMNVPDDGTLRMTVEYMQILFLGMFSTMGFNMNAGLLQGLGDSMTSLKLLILSTLVNIGLDILFAGPFGWGVRGVALATVIAQFISWILGILYFNKNYSYIKLNFAKLDYNPKIFREAMKLGLPSALQNALFSIGSMAMMALISTYGFNFIAGFNVANKIDTLIFLPMMSLANAATTYTGQNVGAKRLDRIYQGVKSSLVLALSLAVGLGVLLYPFLTQAIELFIGTADSPEVHAEVVKAGLEYLQPVLPAYIFLALLFTFNGVLRGLGQTYVPMFATMAALLVARVPSAYYIAAHYGRQYIFFSYGIGWALGAITAGGYYLTGVWKKKLDFAQNTEVKAR